MNKQISEKIEAMAEEYDGIKPAVAVEQVCSKYRGE